QGWALDHRGGSGDSSALSPSAGAFGRVRSIAGQIGPLSSSSCSIAKPVDSMGEIPAMAELPALIRGYCELLEQESRLEERKGRLRQEILAEMGRLNVADVRYPHGHAQRSAKFKLIPRRDEVIGLLERDDLFPFAHFTPPKVKEILV